MGPSTRYMKSSREWPIDPALATINLLAFFAALAAHPRKTNLFALCRNEPSTVITRRVARGWRCAMLR